MLRRLAVVSLAAGVLGAMAVLGTTAFAANDHTVPMPDTFSDINPCTGDVVMITETYTKSVMHESTDANGGAHFTGTLVATLETSDGFSGRQTIWFGDNASGDGSHDVNSFTFSATLGNGSGQRVVIHENAHMTIVDGNPVVVRDSASFECRGKPNA
jgi:hypothetical protein